MKQKNNDRCYKHIYICIYMYYFDGLFTYVYSGIFAQFMFKYLQFETLASQERVLIPPRVPF